MSLSEREQESLLKKTEVINVLPKTYFDLIERVGHSGKYQIRLLFVFIIIWTVTGVLLLSTAFLFRKRSLDCRSNGLLISEKDCLSHVCKLPESDRPQYYAIEDNSFKSLATDGKYLCEGAATIDLISSSTYLGAFVGYLVISFFADNFGRRSSMLISWGICTLGTILVAASVNIYMVAVGLFLGGMGSDAGINICFFFFGEAVGD